MIGIGTILTKGLGGDATALVLGAFRLFIGVEVGPPPPQPPAGGGGGLGGTWAPPRPWEREEPQRQVTVTVRLRDRTWQQSYTVGEARAQAIVRAVQFINVVKARLSVGVSNIRKAAGKVAAFLTPKDK